MPSSTAPRSHKSSSPRPGFGFAFVASAFQADSFAFVLAFASGANAINLPIGVLCGVSLQHSACLEKVEKCAGGRTFRSDIKDPREARTNVQPHPQQVVELLLANPPTSQLAKRSRQ
jgi:hypothetical protein